MKMADLGARPMETSHIHQRIMVKLLELSPGAGAAAGPAAGPGKPGAGKPATRRKGRVLPVQWLILGKPVPYAIATNDPEKPGAENPKDWRWNIHFSESKDVSWNEEAKITK